MKTMVIFVTVMLLASGTLAFQGPVPHTTRRRTVNSHTRQSSFSTTSLHDVATTLDAVDAISTTALTNDVSTLDMIDAFYKNDPYIAAFLTCSSKASVADMLAQAQASATDWADKLQIGASSGNKRKKEENTSLDVRRNLAFWLYGGFYQGMVQQYLYGTLYPAVFGGTDEVTLARVAEQVLVDTCFVTPFICLPIAYTVKECVTNPTLESLTGGVQRYLTHIQEEGLLFKYWSIWIPAQFLTFGVVPEHLRIVFVATVSFFWLMLFSTISSTSSTSSQGFVKPEPKTAT